MSTPHHNHTLKFKRAQNLLTELYRAELNWFNSGEHCRSVFELDPQDSEYILLKASADPVPLEPFSLLVSEILHNLRSGLDNLAFALAVANCRPGNVPDDIAELSQFPIVGDEDRKGQGGQGRQCSKVNFVAFKESTQTRKQS
jgi:hypothetical protein